MRSLRQRTIHILRQAQRKASAYVHLMVSWGLKIHLPAWAAGHGRESWSHDQPVSSGVNSVGRSSWCVSHEMELVEATGCFPN